MNVGHHSRRGSCHARIHAVLHQLVLLGQMLKWKELWCSDNLQKHHLRVNCTFSGINKLVANTTLEMLSDSDIAK